MKLICFKSRVEFNDLNISCVLLSAHNNDADYVNYFNFTLFPWNTKQCFFNWLIIYFFFFVRAKEMSIEAVRVYSGSCAKFHDNVTGGKLKFLRKCKLYFRTRIALVWNSYRLLATIYSISFSTHTVNRSALPLIVDGCIHCSRQLMLH